MKKRFLIFFVMLAILASMTFPVYAALEDGAYIVSNNAYYANPDTGKTDDGGDTSIGEGMSRNVNHTESLYELKDGKHYVTVRLKLVSFMSKVDITIQTKKGDPSSYQSVKYKVTGENKEDDTRDFCFEVKDPSLLIRPITFVDPMGRDVIFFTSLNMSSAKTGNGDFAVTNAPAGKAAASAEQGAQGTSNASEPAASANKGSGTSGASANKELPAEVLEALAKSEDPGQKNAEAASKSETIGSGTAESEQESVSSQGEPEESGSEDGKADEEVQGLSEFDAQGENLNTNHDKDQAGRAPVLSIAAASIVVLGVEATCFIEERDLDGAVITD